MDVEDRVTHIYEKRLKELREAEMHLAADHKSLEAHRAVKEAKMLFDKAETALQQLLHLPQ